ncbi:guanylate cyclase 32E-like isoform X2 [Uloborus diversus]|uniref:guanylate cyclase 32E-like isoform X1 n=1 Tax=Uloborus diversus TaxID=327109 RepID=UPI00240A6490|nr:guanylate cyclase 32E-like isoform X1 [Uloborus diversus]XP_054712048.1 guanylate cyclase 32E-like isoform X2 [Uloborus diversus]
MAYVLFLASTFAALSGAELPPHYTVTDLQRVKLIQGNKRLDPGKPNITIGFLSDFQDVGKLIAGAIPLAVDLVNNDPQLLPRHNLRFITYDSGGPNSAVTIKKMTQMREEGVVAFIGPDHSCVSEALVAAAWDMPMITYKCSDSKVSNKTIFTTFARTLPPSSKVSKSLISLLKYFKWNRLMLLVANNPSDKQVAESLLTLAERHEINIADTYYLPGDYLTKDNTTLKDIVLKTYERTRVYVVIADTYTLVDFVRFMQEQGLFDNGEYIVISLEEEELFDPNKQHQYIRRDFEASYMTADPVPFRSVLLLSQGSPIHPDYEYFQDLVLNYSEADPFNIPSHPVIKVEVPIYAGLAFDAVMIYASALTQALADNKSECDGTAVFNYIRSRPYESILGFSVMIDDQGDAEGNYTVMALVETEDNPSLQRMRPVARFTHQGSNDLPLLRVERGINWIAGVPPLSEPRCGFSGERCDTKPEWRMIVIYCVCCMVTMVAGFFVLRHYRYEHKLACLLWKVEMKDLVLLRSDHDGAFQRLRSNFNDVENGRIESTRPDSMIDHVTNWSQSKVGFYKGNVVHIYHVYKKNIDLTRSLRKEMIQIREMRHENINPFIGACVDPPNICILTLFCARGSLQDVLKNADLHLDTMFIASLVADLVKGMIYIHESEIVSHGNLKSSNCIVDSRWMLKITDFGLHEFRANQDPPKEVEEIRSKSLLWRAPELIRKLNPPPRGTQKGDVYSFGIILFEIMGRIGPWGKPEPSLKYVEERVSNPQNYGDELFRPPSQELDCPDYIKQCMEECWQEDPESRPDFRFIKVKLRVLHSGLNTNIFDNMINIMEKYAYNLESVVKDRTNQLLEEKKKTENLLLRMLPKPVAEQLLRGEKVEAESFDSVTIYFSDIVGFTSLSAVSTPLQVVDLLNDLYTCFDSIIGHFDVYKVETIGDAYMVVSGLPIRNGKRHAGEIASLALRLLEAIHTFKIRHRPRERLSLRIGINSGPCVAGVVGLKMPRYCLFGDTVNTASRMESSGEAMKIHVSEACKQILDKIGGYVLQERGLIQIKGKGEMRTYWLIGKQCSNESSATFQPRASPSPPISVSWLSRDTSFLSDFEDGFPSHLGTPTRNESCLSLFQGCKRNAENTIRGVNGYRSAPVISFDEFFSPTDCIL